VLHGLVQFAEESNLSSLVALVTGGEPEALDDWATRYPTATGDVASVVRQMLTHAEVLRGRTCHWSGSEALTKYEMACNIADVLDAPTGHLRPDRRPHADRPRDPRLDCQLLEDLGVGTRTPLREVLPQVITCALGQEIAP
jgi:dTDP-4-dehydrorhamnose reductase